MLLRTRITDDPRRWPARAALALALALTALGAAGGGAAAQAGNPVSGKSAQLDSRLARVASTSAGQGNATGAVRGRALGLDTVGNNVRVVLETTDASAARAAVRTSGGSVEASYGGHVQALVQPAALKALAQSPAISYVRPPLHAQPDAIGEGVEATGAKAWETAGRGGAGVKVGIIDFGFTGYAARQAAGDLPGSLQTADFCSGHLADGGEHGTAVAEIVHQLAPDAKLYLICIETDVQLGLAEQYAKANGITIVNHSATWFNSSRGDGSGGAGSPDAIVADARANGILWINSAGNYAHQHWSGSYSDTDGDEADLHNFTSGDNYNGFYIAGGGMACVTLKWDDWPISSQDYDLYLYDQDDNDPVAVSVNDQSGGGAPPTEDLCYQNPSPSAQPFYAAISRYDATERPRFDLYAFGDVSDIAHQVLAGSIPEPASAPAALAVGAVCWKDSSLERYSSLGPTIAGRVKPDIAGPDSTSTETYGAFGDNGECGTGGFPGTSASSPHVAGAAALAAARYPAYGPAQLQSYLEGTAHDLGAKGKDSSFGSGAVRLPAIAAPPVTGFAPAAGPVGTHVTVTGTGFTGATAVSFGGVASTSVTAVTATSLQAVVPDGASTGKVRVVSPDGTGTSTADFKVTPTVGGFDPSTAARGATVTIHGSNFTGATKVLFGAVAVPSSAFTVSDDEITLLVPGTAATGKVTVTTAVGSGVSAGPFTVIPPPKLTSFSPAAAPIGAPLTITGTALDAVTSATVHGVDAGTVQHLSPTQIRVTVPVGATTGRLGVNGSGGAAASATDFKVAPRVDGFTPATGTRSVTEVTIDGVGFAGATKVAFGTVTVLASAFTSLSDTKITLKVPATAVSGKLTVTTASGSGASVDPFVVILPPKVTSFTPSSGAVGAVVTVNGTSLDTVHAAAINGVDVGTIQHVSPSRLTITVPEGAVTDTITVAGDGGPGASLNQFKVSPKVTGFEPSSAVRSTPVDIVGVNLTGATKVLFGTVGVPASAFTFASDTRITVPVPATALSGKITVTTAAGSGASGDPFVVMLPPKVASFTPASGAVGATVTVSGTGLAVTGAKVGGVAVAAPLVHVSPSQLKLVVPAGASSGKVQVANAIPLSADSALDFRVSPTVTGFSPAVAARNTPVEISGVNLAGATKVQFGTVAVPVTSATDTKLTVPVPATAVSGKLTVTTAAGSGVSAEPLVVLLLPKVTSFTPSSGPVGATVTVSGGALDAVTSATVGGVSAALQHVSPTQVKVTVPAGAATGAIAVSGPGGGGASTSQFKVTPSVTSFAPASAARGAGVVLSGSGFTGATKVLFGTVAATFSVDSDTTITTTVPATASTGKITVTTPAGSGAGAAAFTVGASVAGSVLKVNLSGRDVDSVDPALASPGPSWQLLHAVCANLVAFGDDRSVVEPEVATALPEISPDGTTYTFTLRDGFRFAPPSNQPVTAQTFKAAIDRLANPALHSPAAPFISTIQGVAAVQAGVATGVSGVVADGNQLTITLTKASGDLLSLLATPWFCAVPTGTPAQAVSTFASAGPFSVAARTAGKSIVLKRNPYYAGSRTVSLDEIDVAVNTDPEQSRQAIEAGSADYEAGALPAAQQDRLFTQYGPASGDAQRYFVDPLLETDYLALNTSRGPFADIRLRRAVNLALDRPALVAALGEHTARATDQFLPPGMPGFDDASIYPLDGPDLAAAEAALPADFDGASVVLYTSTGNASQLVASVVQANLAKLDIAVDIESFPFATLLAKCGTRTEPFDICSSGWQADYPDPVNFLGLFDGTRIRDTGNDGISYLDDPLVNGRFADDLGLTGTARSAAYGALDVDIARDAAPIAAWGNRTQQSFFSPRVGCQVYQPVFGMDLAALCLE